MEHSGVNPRSQVDFTEQSSVTSTCDVDKNTNRAILNVQGCIKN